MRQIRLVWPAVLVSIAVIGTTACGQHVHGDALDIHA
jgi:hypothetical protein